MPEAESPSTTNDSDRNAELAEIIPLFGTNADLSRIRELRDTQIKIGVTALNLVSEWIEILTTVEENVRDEAYSCLHQATIRGNISGVIADLIETQAMTQWQL